MAAVSTILFRLCIVAALLPMPVVDSGDVGIGYGLIGPYQMSQKDGLQKLRSLGVRMLKTWSIDPGWLDNVKEVFGNSVKVTVAIPNADLQKVANNDQGHLNWVKEQLNKYKDIINLVAVGNEPYLNRATAWAPIVPAAGRIHQLLKDNNLLSNMKMTVPFSSAVLADTHPVANSRFQSDAISSIQQILGMIREEGSVFSINLYPYFAYVSNSEISLDVALGRYLYRFRGGGESLLKNMLDGCKVALQKAGYEGVPVIIGETGWPTSGGKDTNNDNAKAYTEQVMRLAGKAQAIYIFEAFDEAGKGGDEVERHWGIMSSNGEQRFAVQFPTGTGPPTGGTINWNGDWAMGCDFPGNDMSNMQIRGEDCSNKCASTNGCTHYAWTRFNGGTCWLKSGHASKADAVVSSEEGAVCGVI